MNSLSFCAIIAAITLPLQALADYGEKEPPKCSSEIPKAAKTDCGEKLSRLCRNQQSMRRLKDNRIVIAGGLYADEGACDMFIFDPQKKSISNVERVTPELQSVTGFKIDENRIAFTNRLPGDDYISRDANDRFEAKDLIVFWNADTKMFEPGSLTLRSISNVSTPAFLRLKDEAKLVVFYGHEKGNYYENCGEDPKPDGSLACHQRYTIDVYGMKLKPDVQGEFNPPPTRPWRRKKEVGGEKSDSEDGGLTYFGSLNRARVRFDVTTFNDGRLFLVGGQEQDRDGKIATAETGEFYLPEKGWFETAPLPKPALHARSHGINQDEVLVVDLEKGEGWTWSFQSKVWKSAFRMGHEISRGMMHSSGAYIALAKSAKGNGEQLLIWRPGSTKLETIPSPLHFRSGTGMIELGDQRIMEAQRNGVLLWDLKAKKPTRLKL